MHEENEAIKNRWMEGKKEKRKTQWKGKRKRSHWRITDIILPWENLLSQHPRATFRS